MGVDVMRGAGRVTHGIHTNSYRNGLSCSTRGDTSLCGRGSASPRRRQGARTPGGAICAARRTCCAAGRPPQQRSEAPRNYVAAPRYDNQKNPPPPPSEYGYSRPYYSTRSYPRTVIVPRFIRPSIVTVVPYRPYVYHPSFSLGVYYGAGGAYPYGYTPRGYYDPLPGHFYGGLRITGAPRDAQVFADGYYVGIVNDFDGVFQHINLEAGTHHIEIRVDGVEPIAFDVNVQPGQTITYRADLYQP